MEAIVISIVIMSVTSLVLSCLAIGAITIIRIDLKSASVSLKDRVREFDEITLKASTANNSLGTKIIEVEERLLGLEYKTGSTAPIGGSPTPWKR